MDGLWTGCGSAPRFTKGREIFADELTRFAERVPDRRLTPIIHRVRRPIRVAILGRNGVGRRTLAGALAAAGDWDVVLSAPDTPGSLDTPGADVHVLVVAETLKPEDKAVLAAAGQLPTVLVLNKADLTGAGMGGPLAAAARRAADFRAMTGVPTVPAAAALASVDLDGELRAALQTLTTEPGDLTSVDAFVATGHRIPRAIRARLLATLDRFGIAYSVLALGRGVGVDGLAAELREISGIERVTAEIDAAVAPVRYRRTRTAITELRALAARCGDARITEFLAADQTAFAVMVAAVDVVEAAGAVVDRGDDPDAHLRRAVCWRHYSHGPVNALHRSCGDDITRGSLRLLGNRSE